MTKEIAKAFILQEVQDKFKLRELIPEKFTFSEMVIPVYDINPHLMHAEVNDNTKPIDAGPEAYEFFRVPADERWHVHRYNVIFITGSYTLAGIMIYRPTVANYIYIDLKAAQSTSYAVDLPKDILLEPGDLIMAYVDGYTSTGNLQVRVDVTKEEIR